ncbi:efflux RND transporter permease subunit [Nocardioides sp. W7]|uniref:MMPL family transporter n=1 Tax=Nocardioides sp. W7 TaxID=2931390 RepID=UPI001FD35D4B|nr:efflux RND transporter permease subunit [Nocardioides sp. W7]
MQDWATRLTGRRTAWLVALVPLLLAVAVLGLLGEGEREQTALDNLPEGMDSTLGAELREELPESDTSAAIILVTADEGRLDPAVLETVPLDVEFTVAEDGTAAVAVLPVKTADGGDASDAVEELRDTLDESLPEGVTGQVSGPAAIQADLSAVFQGADVRLLLSTVVIVALLLVITYRSPVLWLIPLTVVGIADRLAAVLATQAMAVLDVAWDQSTVGILSVLVFGAGTDYSLLLISRYRDELRATPDRFAAMAQAVRRTTEAVLASAVTVVLGVLTLLLSLTPTTRGLGLACAIGVVVAAFFALVVLPATLVLFGRWVFWPRVPHEGDTALVDAGGFWHRVGVQVGRRPAAFVTGSILVLAVLALGTLRIDTGLDRADQFLDEPEAISAAERAAESFPAGLTDPARVVTNADAGTVLERVEATAGVGSVRVTGEGNGVTQLDAVLEGASGSTEARDTVLRLREGLADLDDTHVLGAEAEAIDEAEAAQRDRMLILPLLLALVLGALLLLLRAVVAPLLLVLTVLATYAASLGASWWLFTRVLGFEALDTSTPLFAFLFLVALGVDYNIFLVTRAREEAREHGSREGMLRGLTATGGVITSAGILLAAVFAVLGVLPLVVLAQIGTVICIGVLLDTLLVRTVLVPALAMLLGDRFWWPRRVAGSAETEADTPVEAQARA